MPREQTPDEIVKAAHAEQEAEARLSARIDHLLAKLSEPPQGWHAIAPQGWTPEASWVVAAYVLEVVHRAGMSDAFRALLMNLAAVRRDGLMLAALGAEKKERMERMGEFGGDRNPRVVEVIDHRNSENDGRYTIPGEVPMLGLKGDAEPVARELVRRMVEREAETQTHEQP